NRHCERSEAIQSLSSGNRLDCFVAEPVIGPAQEGRTRWLLAMTNSLRLCPPHRSGPKSRTSAADLKSLTHSRQNRVQGLQIESGTRIIDLLVPITFRSPRKGVAAMVRGLRKVGTSPSGDGSRVQCIE